MIRTLISSQTRVKLIKKFFLNRNTESYLRGLESEFGESTNSIRLELNRFEKAGLLRSKMEGNKKMYQANHLHPLYNELHNIIIKEEGIDRVIEKVIHKLGNLEALYLSGELARGNDSKQIELILVGADLDNEYLRRKIKQAEEIVGRSVKYMVLCPKDVKNYLLKKEQNDVLLLWKAE